MNDALLEMAQFVGKACGIIARDLAEISQPLAEAFRRGWRQSAEEKPQAEAARSRESAPESV